LSFGKNISWCEGSLDMTVQPVIRFRFLGRFSAVVDGEPPTHVRISSKKGIALLAYLAMHPEHTVSRERLATLLWGDRLDQQARSSLRQCILSLRNALLPASTDLLALDGDAVGLRMERVTVDALEFQMLGKSTDLADLARAAQLYRGEFLSDLSLDSETFSSWLRATRARLEAEAAGILEVCADRLDAANRGAEAMEAAERLVAIDPLREDWQRRLLWIYARQKGRNAALAYAKTVIEMFKNELDVDPEPATSAVIDDIQRHEVEPAERAVGPPSVIGVAGGLDAPSCPPASLPQVTGRAPIAPDQPHWTRTPRAIVPQLQTFFPMLSPRISRSLETVLPLLSVVVVLGFLGQYHPMLGEIDTGASAAKDAALIAVVPFTQVVDSGDSSAIADTISDDLVDTLSSIGDFRVISRQTSRQYRGQPKDVMTIGNELGVRYVVDGGVKIEDNKLRVNVELIDTRSRLQVWSDRYEVDRTNRFVADDIVRGIARALQINLIRIKSKRSAALKSARPDADELLAKGWDAMLSNGPENRLEEAEAAFSEVLRIDPESIGAMLGLAEHHITAVFELAVASPEPYLSEAEQLLDRVLRRRPESGKAYFDRSFLQSLRGELLPGLASVERSLSINPSFAPGYVQLGRLLTRLGRFDEARERIQYAIRLSPKDPALPIWTMVAGWTELECSRNEAALELLSRSVALNPNNPLVQGSLAAAYALDGDRADADLHAAKFRALTPGITDERRLARFGGSHRLAEGVRLALGNSP
jgi:DNA-binding SARP family transcriptional activator/TolB-like protein